MADIKYIDIDKTLIPYSFDIKLDEVTYTIEVNYNNSFDYFTLNLIKQGVPLKYGEKLVYGKMLFDTKIGIDNGVYSIIRKTNDFPKVAITPYDLSEKQNRITFDNLGDTVFLYLITEGELNE